MKVECTEVRKVEKENSKLKGFAKVKIDDCFVVNDIRIIEGENGLFIAMPSRPNATGGFHDVAHPINQETRKLFEDAVFEEYNKAE